MSLLKENPQSWMESFACRVLKCGPVPRHVAFIMDGNRRWAKKAGLISPVEGHVQGFHRLADTLQWCRNLGIVEVTVYAFSLENFKRSEAEVEGIWRLAEEKLGELWAERERMERHKVRIRFLGDLSRLPPSLRKLANDIQTFSAEFGSATLNVCMAYTSQDELRRAAVKLKSLGWGASEAGLEHCLDTAGGEEVELLVRTSGEQRLSDFLLWQASSAVLYFTPVLWPEFSFWDLAKALLHFQRFAPDRDRLRAQLYSQSTDALHPIPATVSH